MIMAKTKIDMVYKVLLAGETIHRDQVDFKLSDVISELREEGFDIKYDPVYGYWMEVDVMPASQLAVLQKAARYGLLDEQKAAA